MKRKSLLLILFALVAFGPTAWAQLTGNGTSSDPYLITSTEDWNTFAESVNNGTTYWGQTVKLNADIGTTDSPVTTMVGGGDGSNIVFSGTFDGDGHTITFNLANATEQYIAPFRRISNATIKHLKVTGTVSSSNRFAGGIVAYAKGNSTVTDCMNSTSITCVNKNGASNGGIVGMVGASGTLTISGCVFNGQMSGTSSTDWCGILGLCNGGCTANIRDCFVDPASAEVNGNTIYRNGDNATTNCSNCYYTETIGTAQGKLARSITGGENVTVENAGTVTSEATIGVTGYSTGIKYNDVLYAGKDDNVNLNLITEPGYAVSNVTYTPAGGTATAITPDEENVYTFTMPDANVTINANVTLVSVFREIEGYGDGDGKWAFISSPVEGSIAPAEVTNLIGHAIPETNPVVYDFDLYRFNPNANLEWENYHAHTSDFNIINGMGYLYATKETKTLTFSGSFNTGTSKDVTGLPAGFNLVGNPFTVDAYVSKSYYTLNGDGSAILTTTSDAVIPPCYGVIVQVDGSETVTFTTAPTQQNAVNNGGLQIAVSQVPELVEGPARDKGGVSTGSTTATLDNAIVSFNEGERLGKFYFGNQNANIYLPQNGKDYAIAYSDRAGEMPVNFKAKENGQYTITVKPEGVEMSYLHLIDNMTGADIDLLAPSVPEPVEGPNASGTGPSTLRRVQGSGTSYTFTAKTTDYASRFKLVFVTNNEDGPSTGSGTEGSGTFAFISNGNIILTAGADDAILQIVDVMGRVLVSRDALNASPISTTGMTPGVYVLRLINGDDVKTQKIIIE